MGLNPFANRTPLRVSQGRTPVTDQMTSYAGGLNTVSADDALGPNQFRRGDNGRLTLFGAFTKRGGTQRTAAALIAATAVQNGYAWHQPAGTTITMAVCGGTLFTTPYGAFPLTWTQRGSVADLSTTVTPSLAEFLQLAGTDSVYIADGGLLNRYTGTTLTKNIASTPSVNVLAVHNQRLWGCGDSAYPDSIWYSALNDGDSLGIAAGNGGQIVVRTFGDQNVVGLISLGTSLMIFHQRGVSRLTGYGQDDVTVTPAGISGDVGTIAAFSPTRVDNLVYFLSDRGLYRASEQMVEPVNTPEKPDPLAVILPTMTAANIANIRTVLNRATHELWIQIPGVGLYVYHTILQAWAGPWVDGYQSPQTNCLFETNNADGYPIVLRGDASGFVSECDRPNVGLDNVAASGTGGTSFAMALQCRRFYCQDPNVAKAWRFGYILAQLAGANATTASWSTDSTSGSQALPASLASAWGGSSTSWGTGTWGAVAQASYRVDLDGNGYYIDVLVTDSSAATPIINQVRVQGYALGRR
jgi:hypothetical protein